MISLVLYFVVMAGTMILLTRVLPGFVVTGWGPALWAAFWLALLNTLLQPVLFLLRSRSRSSRWASSSWC